MAFTMLVSLYWGVEQARNEFFIGSRQLQVYQVSLVLPLVAPASGMLSLTLRQNAFLQMTLRHRSHGTSRSGTLALKRGASQVWCLVRPELLAHMQPR